MASVTDIEVFSVEHPGGNKSLKNLQAKRKVQKIVADA
jgi:hypothetical protein